MFIKLLEIALWVWFSLGTSGAYQKVSIGALALSLVGLGVTLVKESE